MTNTLSIFFTASECNGWPKIKFYLDDDLYEDFTFTDVSSKIDIPLSLLDGEHELTIEIYNKTNASTLLDENNNIVKDQLITLDQIAIDDVILPDFVKYSGVYIVGDNTYPQALTWGLNGRWVLKFSVPFITWVLDLKNQKMTISKSKKLSVGEHTEYKKQKLIFYLDKLEEILTKCPVTKML
jgi:hypothetical protein